MRKLYAMLIGILLSTLSFAQNVGVNTTNPDASSILDVSSNDKGVLLPRVSLTDVTDNSSPISNPAVGLLVYNTNAAITGGDGEGFYYYNGTEWVKLVTDAGGTATVIVDTDGDTKVQVEESTDEDIIRFDVAGNEAMQIGNNGGVGIGTDAPDKGIKVLLENYNEKLDQSMTAANVILNTSSPGWQSFTAGMSGYLTAVSLRHYSTYAPDSITITIYEGAGNSGTPLFADRIAINGNWNTVDISGVQIVADSMYTIGVDNRSGWGSNDNYAYSGGTFINVPYYDAMFRTYVTGYHAQGSFSVDSVVRINDYAFPTADGNTGQVLTTDGAGALSWIDEQTLSLSGSDLSITNGNTIDLSTIDTDTDAQTLSLSGTDLSITNGNTVDLSTIIPDIDKLVDTDGDTKIQVEENTDEDQIRFDIAGNEAMLIDNYGHVGIGNNMPSVKLDVKETDVSYIAAIKGQGANGPTVGYIGVSGKTDFDGIGTLDISGLDIGLLGVSTGSSSADNYAIYGHSNNWAGKFENSVNGNTVYIGGTDHALVTEGYVGIGIASPNFELHIHDATNTNSWMQFTHSGTGSTSSDGFIVGINNNNEGQLLLREDANMKFSTDNSVRMTIDGDGNVGIGDLTPDSKLDVEGEIQAQQIRVGGGNTISQIQFGTLLVGTSSNNVGLVTATFSQAFSSKPRIILTARTDNTTTSTSTKNYMLTTRNVSTTGFQIIIESTGSQWTNNLLIDYIAID